MSSTAGPPGTDRAADVRAEVLRILSAENISRAQVAKEIAIAVSSVGLWLNETYPGGGGEHVQRALEKWLAARPARKETLDLVPQSPAFRETPTTRRILDDLAFAHHMRDIAMIVGPAGIGKTSACEEYKKRTPSVWVATLHPSAGRIGGVLQRACKALKLEEKNPQNRHDAIVERLRGTMGLLIIDEAQNATTPALDELRSIRDEAGVGLALVGNESLLARLLGDGRKREYAQLHSRLGVRNVARVSNNDIATMLDAWGITEESERRLAAVISRRAGHFRNLAKTMVMASLLASGLGEERSIVHMRAAYERLTCSDDDAADGSAA